MVQNTEILKDKTSEMIARGAFGSADWLKVQSQHERFLKEIKNLPENDKAREIANAVKYLHENKSDYWLELAHLLHELLGDKENEGLYQVIEPNIAKKDFCKKYLNMSYKTVSAYVKIIRDFEDYGFNEDQIRVLGFGKTRDILQTSPRGDVSDYSKKTIEELKELKYNSIRRKKRTPFEKLVLTWEQASEEERKKFLRFINEERTDSEMG